MARINIAKNFAGQQYATQKYVDDKIGPIPQGIESVIDPETGNLDTQLNPIAVASMQNSDGSTDFSKLKIIGDCSVIYGANGTITLRIGPALNCSLFDGTDGVSTTSVSYKANNTQTATVSGDYSQIANTGNRTIVVKGENDTFTANCGTTATTETTAGNSVHFEDAVNGKFKVYIGSGKNAATVQSYVFGPITANGTYYEDGAASGAIACAITNFKDEPKLASGANGKCANVNFTFTPNAMFDETTDFRIVKIEQLEGDDVVATWTNSTATVYMFMAQTNVPTTPESASYTISKSTKQISGVTYLTTASTVTPSATGLANIAYPGYVSNKLNCAPSGGTWFTSFNETATSTFTTWTDEKDVTMSWKGAAKSLLIGSYDDPEITVKGTNMHGSGSGVTSQTTNNALYICDTNGYTSSTHGSISQSGRLDNTFTAKDFSAIDLSAEGNTDLQIENGYVVYPSNDYSSYNKNGQTAINPDYSGLTGDRYYYVKLSKSGTIMGGTITIATAASAETALKQSKDAEGNWNAKLRVQLSNDKTNWMDIGRTSTDGGIGATFSYGTSNKISFSIPNASYYGNGFLYARVTMTSDANVKIASIALS